MQHPSNRTPTGLTGKEYEDALDRSEALERSGSARSRGGMVTTEKGYFLNGEFFSN